MDNYTGELKQAIKKNIKRGKADKQICQYTELKE